MIIARYWGAAEAEVQGPDRAYLLTIRRGSDISLEDAQQRAEEAAAEIGARCEAGQEPPDSYAYSTRQLPEPILEEIHNAEGERVGAITINRFGCEVLNTSRLAFLDIDLVPSKKRSGGLLSRLFGSAPTPAVESPEETAAEGAISQLGHGCSASRGPVCGCTGRARGCAICSCARRRIRTMRCTSRCTRNSAVIRSIGACASRRSVSGRA